MGNSSQECVIRVVLFYFLESSERLSDGQHNLSKVDVQHRSRRGIESQQRDKQFGIGGEVVHRVVHDAPSAQRKADEQEVNQHKDGKQDLVRFHGADRHVEAEDQVAEKGNAQLLGVRGCRELLAEYAHLDEP